MKIFFFLILLVLVVSQFIRPTKNQASYETITAFEKSAAVSNEVKSVLEAKCYDCHSNSTKYPWYMEVSPITHWMAHHIKEGRAEFNVSEWENYTDKQKNHKLEEFIEELEGHRMPLKPYTWIHGKLTNSETDTLINWAKKGVESLNKVVDTMLVKEVDSIMIDSVL